MSCTVKRILNLGIPISGEVNPIMDPGRRQEWQYNIKYFGGDIQSFILPCTSIPLEHMSLVDINRRIELSIRQIPHDDSS